MAGTSRKSNQNEDLSHIEFETSEDVEVVPTFQSMKLREELLRGIYAYGEFLLFEFHSWKLSNLT